VYLFAMSGSCVGTSFCLPPPYVSIHPHTSAYVSIRVLIRNVGQLRGHPRRAPTKRRPQFTCFTGAKVQELTHLRLAKQPRQKPTSLPSHLRARRQDAPPCLTPPPCWTPPPCCPREAAA
jgi:hypothetical protein